MTERNQRRLHEAAERLLEGRARLSDGRLTLKSLAVEAGVPRQYLYRDPYKSVASEFDRQAKALLARAEEPDARLAELSRLRESLEKAEVRARTHRAEAARLHADLQQAASQIAFLNAQNASLREQLRLAGSVTPLRTVTPG